MSIRFTVAVLTGGNPRNFMTASAIRSINLQTHSSIQPVFINNGRSVNELKLIQKTFGSDSSLSNWEVIDMGTNTYDPKDLTSVWGKPGEIFLSKIKGDFVFIQNDDDFLDKEFFKLIDLKFTKYPEAITAFGQVFKWDWNINSVIQSDNNYYGRPELENGLDLFNKVYKDKNEGYIYNPGISPVCKSEMVKSSGKHFFSGGLPDFPPLMQIVPYGLTIFEKNARIFYGFHTGQQRRDWDKKNMMTGIYYKDLGKFANHNIAGAKKCGPITRHHRKTIENFFRERKITYALTSLIYLKANHRKIFSSKSQSIRVVGLHLIVVLRFPLVAMKIFHKIIK